MDKKINRRKFIAGAILLAIAGAGSYFLPKSSFFRAAKNSASALAAENALYTRQIITKNPDTSCLIMWAANNALKNPAVEYRLNGTTKKIAASDESFSDDGIENTQYSAMLTELLPATDYEYRLVTADSEGKWQKMRTAPKGSANYKVLIFPDSQSSDYSDWENLAQNAFKRNGDAAFFVNMGDLVDNGEDHTQWQAWFNALKGIINTIPLAPVMGNHECYDQKWEIRLPNAYLNYFHTPDNGSSEFNRYYYSFDYGDVHYIVLNTQEDEIKSFKQGLNAEQIAWLRQDAHNSSKKWKIVLMHRDVLRYRIHNRPERTEGIEEIGETFMPLFDELNIDIVFTAHLHTYRNRGHLYNMRPADRGPLYILTGVAGNVRYPNLWIDHAYDKATAPQPETDNYITLDVSRDKLTVNCYLPDGTIIDTISVSK